MASDPSFQRGSGSSGSIGKLQQHYGVVVVLVEKLFEQGFA
jgi:hypothetical protein